MESFFGVGMPSANRGSFGSMSIILCACKIGELSLLARNSCFWLLVVRKKIWRQFITTLLHGKEYQYAAQVSIHDAPYSKVNTDPLRGFFPPIVVQQTSQQATATRDEHSVSTKGTRKIKYIL